MKLIEKYYYSVLLGFVDLLVLTVFLILLSTFVKWNISDEFVFLVYQLSEYAISYSLVFVSLYLFFRWLTMELFKGSNPNHVPIIFSVTHGLIPIIFISAFGMLLTQHKVIIKADLIGGFSAQYDGVWRPISSDQFRIFAISNIRHNLAASIWPIWVLMVVFVSRNYRK